MHAVHHHFTSFKYTVKLDDDSYLHPTRLHSLLNLFPSTKLYLGNVWRRQPVDRNVNSKWFVPIGMYAKDTYPFYCSGAGYILSSDLVACIVSKIRDRSYTYMSQEDVATALLAEACRVGPKHTEQIQKNRKENGNNDTFVIRHYVGSREQMKELHRYFFSS